MTQFDDLYRNRRVLLTGHTGFKGSWLTLWLQQLGAEVTALALQPETEPNHWALLSLDMQTHEVDLRDAEVVRRVVEAARPEVVFHLAAQALVRRSYADPLATWSANVMGTANLLEACRTMPGVQAVVVVTSDKCYENRGWPWGYREQDALGGHDPYSASKAATELLAASYRDAFFTPGEGPLLATARAGNVIGGGDWAADRLVPDLVRAQAKGRPLVVRYPEATRPWQHVLESLSGYLRLGQRLLEGNRATAEAWNFGPDIGSMHTVAAVLDVFHAHWPAMQWARESEPQPHEAEKLLLDSTKARQGLGWEPVWGFVRTIEATAAWYRAFTERGEVLSTAQLAQYIEDARAAGAAWCDA